MYDIDQKIIELTNKGVSLNEMTKILGCGKTTIVRKRKKIGISSIFIQELKFSREKFKELYDKGLPDRLIAKELKVSQSAITNYRNFLKLPTNTRHFYEPTALSFEEEQVLIGGLLGDMYLGMHKNARNASGIFAHTTEKQSEYCWNKYNYLKRFCRRPFDTYQDDKRTKKRYYKTCCLINTNPVFNIYYQKFYPNKHKIVPKDLLYKLEGLGLAIWFMDDGSKVGCSGYQLATNSFSLEDLQIIKEFFTNKFDINISIWSNNSIYINKEDSLKFKALIESYIVDCMKYKL